MIDTIDKYTYNTKVIILYSLKWSHFKNPEPKYQVPRAAVIYRLKWVQEHVFLSSKKIKYVYVTSNNKVTTLSVPYFVLKDQ